MTDRAVVCAACRITRHTGQVLAVTERATGQVRYVCRPSLADQHPGRQPCFGIVGPADRYAIALGSDLPRGTEVERRERRTADRARVGRLAAAVAGSR
jgi:hypothetical protein